MKSGCQDKTVHYQQDVEGSIRQAGSKGSANEDDGENQGRDGKKIQDISPSHEGAKKGAYWLGQNQIKAAGDHERPESINLTVKELTQDVDQIKSQKEKNSLVKIISCQVLGSSKEEYQKDGEKSES